MSNVPTNRLSMVGTPAPLSCITLTGADTLTYDRLSDQILYMFNGTAAAQTVKIDGSDSTLVSVPATGDSLDVSAGKSINIAVGEVCAVRLASIAAYLNGPVAVTGGVGITAYIATYY